MNKKSKIILNCVGIAIITFLIVNTISFLIDFYKMDLVGEWSFKWKHGTFFINDLPSGLKFGESNSYGFLLLIFFVALVINFKKKKLKFN